MLNEPVEETAQEETHEPIQEEIAIEGEEPSIDADFESFVNSTSEHEFTEEEKATSTETNADSSSKMVDDFKLRMFMGFFFLLLDGVHGFIFRFVSKYDVKAKDIAFDDDDKEAIGVYFNTPRIMAFINQMPSELIGFMHIEYIYYSKFQELIEDNKLQKKKYKKLVEVEEEEESEEEETKEAPPKKKKAPAKKATAKKKAPAKKAPAKKKEE